LDGAVQQTRTPAGYLSELILAGVRCCVLLRQAGTWRLIYSSGFNGGSLGGSRCGWAGCER
jgi:hypothetical protein